ncbi:MAG: hypothetical protein J1F35_00495 [Erysipelotrichales bacterium]|nr:hypothetical protein [Erysipelotrichales bacterium]
MILVTLGTQNQKFYRLLDYIEKSSIDDEIIVQAGGSINYKSKKMKLFKFINYDEMITLIKKADLVITHGGTGSIFLPLQHGKKVIACARLEKYKEHINDHQTEIVSIFAEMGYLLELNEENNLDDLIEQAKTFKPKEYVSNKDNFIKLLQCEIDE